MPILNYITSIAVEKTTGEIQRKLVGAGAVGVLTEYDDDGILAAMSFRIMTSNGMLTFRLPSNYDGVLDALQDHPKVPRRLKCREQAARVSWRIIKDWVEAQLAIIEAGQAIMEEVFLPYATNEKGQTLFEYIQDNNFKLLTQ